MSHEKEKLSKLSLKCFLRLGDPSFSLGSIYKSKSKAHFCNDFVVKQTYNLNTHAFKWIQVQCIQIYMLSKYLKFTQHSFFLQKSYEQNCAWYLLVFLLSKNSVSWKKSISLDKSHATTITNGILRQKSNKNQFNMTQNSLLHTTV